MANFWDLPKPVREQIYRHHLVRKEAITPSKYREITRRDWDTGRGRYMPALLLASPKLDDDAADIFYGENAFEFANIIAVYVFSCDIHPRHFKMIRKITCTWTDGAARYGFDTISRMKGLQELYLRVDEKAMVQKASRPRHSSQWWVDDDPSPQQQLALTKYPGMSGLLKLSGIPHVQFLKTFNWKKEEVGGPIPGGFLECHVLPKITAAAVDSPRRDSITSLSSTPNAENIAFPFLELPAELRTRIYDLLLCIPGQLHPSTKRPSSVPKKGGRSYEPTVPESALSILAVNKQINDEALGIFYARNSFVFYYPTQLHAFLLSLGSKRRKCIRDITLHYYNTKSGGVDLVDLSFPMLRELPSLRRLHILMRNELERKVTQRRWWVQSHSLKSANPASVPGIKILFTLRGVTDIKLRDLELEKVHETAKGDEEYPNFAEDSKKGCVIKMTKALEHFNAALVDAQSGRVNRKLLEDDQWQTMDVFPALSE